MNRAKTDEPIEIAFGVWTRVGARNHVLGRSPDPLREEVIWTGASPAHVEVQRISGMSQSSVSSSSDVAFCCQYCSNLLTLLKCTAHSQYSLIFAYKV